MYDKNEFIEIDFENKLIKGKCRAKNFREQIKKIKRWNNGNRDI